LPAKLNRTIARAAPAGSRFHHSYSMMWRNCTSSFAVRLDVASALHWSLTCNAE
jgi:hypothetical protein